MGLFQFSSPQHPPVPGVVDAPPLPPWHTCLSRRLLGEHAAPCPSLPVAPPQPLLTWSSRRGRPPLWRRQELQLQKRQLLQLPRGRVGDLGKRRERRCRSQGRALASEWGRMEGATGKGLAVRKAPPACNEFLLQCLLFFF